MKLVMIPSAGGSSMMYQELSDALAGSVDTVLLDYSGHGRRIADPLYKNLDMIVTDLCREMMKQNVFNGEPYAILGYSMGSIVSYEIFQYLKTNHLPMPEHIFLCACSTQHMEETKQITSIPDEALHNYLKALGGTEEDLLEDKAFQQYYFPIIEADLLALNNFETKGQLGESDVSATVLYGAEDEYSETEIFAWSEYFTTCHFHEMPGAHFFIYQEAEKMKEIILENLLISR